jgi:hypothetical protein
MKVIYRDGRVEYQTPMVYPILIASDGSSRWEIEGKIHREEGPAILGADGNWEWWLNDNAVRTSYATWPPPNMRASP